METNKSLKISVNIFRMFGWLFVAVSIVCILIGSKVLTLSRSAEDIIMNVWLVAVYLQMLSYSYVFFLRRQKDRTYKTDMLPHYRSGFNAALTALALALLSVNTTLLALSGVTVYCASYLIITTIQKNDRL